MHFISNLLSPLLYDHSFSHVYCRLYHELHRLEDISEGCNGGTSEGCNDGIVGGCNEGTSDDLENRTVDGISKGKDVGKIEGAFVGSTDGKEEVLTNSKNIGTNDGNAMGKMKEIMLE